MGFDEIFDETVKALGDSKMRRMLSSLANAASSSARIAGGI